MLTCGRPKISYAREERGVCVMLEGWPGEPILLAQGGRVCVTLAQYREMDGSIRKGSSMCETKNMLCPWRGEQKSLRTSAVYTHI